MSFNKTEAHSQSPSKNTVKSDGAIVTKISTGMIIGYIMNLSKKMVPITGAGTAYVLTNLLKDWVDAKVEQQESVAHNAWVDMIKMQSAVSGDKAALIISMYQQDAGDNDCVLGVVAQKGGIGWLDKETSRAYWHSDPSFRPIRCQCHFIKNPDKSSGHTRHHKVKTIPGSPGSEKK